MLDVLLSGFRRPSVLPLNRFRPSLEHLETRFCPAGSISITSLNVVNLGGRTVQVSGTVMDTAEAPIVSVRLSGAVNNTVAVTNMVGLAANNTVAVANTLGLSVVTDDGAIGKSSYSASFNFTTDQAVLGEVDAVAVDNYSNTSAAVTATVTSNAPVIQDFAVSRFGNLWTFTGKVIDEAPAGLTVTFSGLSTLNGRTTTTDANGNFSVTYELSTPGSWLASATTQDIWGLPSSEVSFAI